MRRAVKVGLIALPWALLAYLLWNDLRRLDFLAIDASTEAHTAARQAFVADLAFEGCVGRDAIIDAAQARGWMWDDMGDFPWCHAPIGLNDWLRVQVDPPLPFSTHDENAAFFGFDAAGCMTAWHYQNGAGTTCPEN
ncbi:MAG: hypothetical protein AAF376_03025 [Pseudomonadota bacterium]